jgi:NAD(P)-dependent dehydrogenase (short-subunit alcohol dehydrogenase family)
MPTVTQVIGGTVAFVTGGGSGIGAATCHALAGVGLSVAVIDVNSEAASRTLARMADIRPSCSLAADVSNAADVERAIAAARAEIGEPDYLVNCAGIYPRSAVAEMDEAEWDQVLDTNLKSVFLMSRAVVPLMTAKGGGRIISITSGLGQTGSARGAHYAASKAGITAFSRSLGQEVAAQGISVNCIAPGLTDTPMMRGANDPDYIQSLAARQFGGILGQPEEVAQVVLFLLSEDAALISGQLITMR